MRYLVALLLSIAIAGQLCCQAFAKSAEEAGTVSDTGTGTATGTGSGTVTGTGSGTASNTNPYFDDSFGSTTSKTFEEKLRQAELLARRKPAVDAVLAFIELLAVDKKGKSALTETERVRAIDRFCRLLFQYGRLKRADELTRDELARLKTLESKDKQARLQEAYLNTDVALVYIAQSKFQPAEELLDKAYKIFVEDLGADHPKTILTIADIASMKQHMLNLPEAEAKYKEAFDRALKQPKFGRLALETLAIDYVDVLSRQGKNEECSCVKKQLGVEGSAPILPTEHLETR